MNVFDTLVDAVRQCEIVDLSQDVTQLADGPFATRIESLEPEPGAQFFVDRVLSQLLPEAIGRLHARDFPGGAFLRHELVTASTHAGSHVDAPGHYGPGADRGTAFINDAPPHIFIAPGVLYDASGIAGPKVQLADLNTIGQATGVTEVNNKIVLICTGGNKAISVEAVESLLDAGVRVIGTDSASFDGPIQPMIESFLATGDSSVLWPCHMLGRRRPYYQIERLGGLDRLPPSGFLVLALPMLIEGATAAWTRAVALVPRTENNS